MENKFYREGFNSAAGGIPESLKFNQNYQGKIGIDFQVPDLDKANREEFINGYEDHYRQAYQNNANVQLYFGIS